MRYFSEMRRPLREPANAAAYAPGDLPEGISLEQFATQWSEPVRRAHNTAFRDHWNSVEMDQETWNSSTVEDEAFGPALSFVAVDRSGIEPDVVGYVINAEFVQDWAAQGHTEGYTGLIGVSARWRGRGMARALLQVSARTFAAAGHPYACLGVDTDNATGAVTLYVRLGYEQTHRTTYFGFALDP